MALAGSIVAAGLLEDWYAQTPPGEGLVFEREEGGHVQNDYALRRVLYPALERAGISRPVRPKTGSPRSTGTGSATT